MTARVAGGVRRAPGFDWRYLLAGETDVAEARGSWSALKQLAGA